MLRYYAIMIVLIALAIFLWTKPSFVPNYMLFDRYAVIDLLNILLVFLALVSVIVAESKRMLQEYLVTNLRVIDNHGIIRRNTTVMMANKVERVYTSQSMFQRLFKYGDVVVDTGEDQIVLAAVRNPTEVEGAITQAMASSRR